MKRVIAVDQPPPGHWVGDGFPVQSVPLNLPKPTHK